MKQRALGALADERLLDRGARLAAKAPWLQALGRRLPGSPLKQRPLPNVQRRPFRDRIDEVAKSSRKATTRVAYFPGCLTDWLSPETGEAAVAVLEALGFAVEPVQFSSCCGLPAINAGYKDEATRMMRQTVEAIERLEVDAVVSTSTSCAGAMLHDYARLSEDDPAWAERARAAADRVRDFTSFVAERGIPDEMLGRASAAASR